VLHVHDLVDFVSQEATLAGKHAAEYVKKKNKGTEVSKTQQNCSCVPIHATDGVRYTVPSRIHPDVMADEVTVRFRVGGIYKNQYISVYLNDRRVLHRKRPVMAPGEMESIVLKKQELADCEELTQIIVKIEEE
jgi:hypothetical protein